MDSSTGVRSPSERKRIRIRSSRSSSQDPQNTANATQRKLTTCFICGHETLRYPDAENPDNSKTPIQPQHLSACLCKLFNLAEEEEFSLVHETYCSNCQNALHSSFVIFGLLDKLNRRLEDKRRIVGRKLKSTYASSVESDQSGDINQPDDSLKSRIQLQKKLLHGTTVNRQCREKRNTPTTTTTIDYVDPEDLSHEDWIAETHIKEEPLELPFQLFDDDEIFAQDNIKDNELEQITEDPGTESDRVSMNDAKESEGRPRTRSSSRLKQNKKKYNRFQDFESDEDDKDSAEPDIDDDGFQSEDDSDPPKKRRRRSTREKQLTKRKKKESNTEGGRALECTICGNPCKSAYTLKSHVETHKPHHEQNHVCDLCGTGFYRQSKLNTHKRQMHKPKTRSTCPICGESFRYLKTHMRTHTGEKLFTCTVCGQSLADKKSFTAHERIHTGEKPFTCATCGMQFRWRQSHDRHLSLHLGKKPYVCEHCGKAFRVRENLLEHLHVHTKEAPHRCTICGRRFASPGLLIEHLGLDHTAEQIERKKQTMQRNLQRRKEAAASAQ